MLRSKVIAELNYIVSGGREDYLGVIRNVTDYFLSLISPKNLNSGDKDNITVQFKVQFEELCIALMSNGIPDPGKMTVFRFYSALKFFEDKKRKSKMHGGLHT